MTPLEKTLKRRLAIDGVEYVITLSPQSLKITLKNHRLGVELAWKELISGESALAVALRASVGKFEVGAAQVPAVQERDARPKAPPNQKKKPRTPKRKVGR